MTETERTSVFFLDSRYRSHGSNVDFYVDLTGDGNMLINYRNVTKVELVSMSISNEYANNNNEHYFILDIKELNQTNIFSNNPYAQSKFSCVYFEQCCPDSTTGLIKPIKGRDFFTKSKIFDPPLPVINRFTVRLLNPSTGEVLPDHGYVTLSFHVVLKNT